VELQFPKGGSTAFFEALLSAQRRCIAQQDCSVTEKQKREQKAEYSGPGGVSAVLKAREAETARVGQAVSDAFSDLSSLMNRVRISFTSGCVES